VEVFAIAKPGSDPHRIEALPSYMVKVSRAKLYLKIGLGLDQWADAIVDGSRNSSVQIVDCSRDVHVLEKPTGKVDASMGDVHPDGNPHYWLDPRNGAVVANNIADALAEGGSRNAEKYHARAEAFGKDAQAAWERNAEAAKKLGSHEVFTYHRSWSYFADAFGLDVVNTVEPVPGIPPTAKHLAELVDQAKARKVGLLIQEPYFASDGGKFLEREAGVRPVSRGCLVRRGHRGQLPPALRRAARGARGRQVMLDALRLPFFQVAAPRGARAGRYPRLSRLSTSCAAACCSWTWRWRRWRRWAWRSPWSWAASTTRWAPTCWRSA
jgi:zinc/manganese transport system substrate-binding protein